MAAIRVEIQRLRQLGFMRNTLVRSAYQAALFITNAGRYKVSGFTAQRCGILGAAAITAAGGDPVGEIIVEDGLITPVLFDDPRYLT